MWTGVLCALLAGAMWGMVFLVPVLLPAFSPVELALGRYTAYGVLALCLTLPRLGSLAERLVPQDYSALVRHALAGNIVYYMLLALAVQLAGVAPASLIIGLLPIAITLMGRKDHGAAPMRSLAMPLLLACAGIACINVDLFRQAQLSDMNLGRTVLGMLSAFGALLCWSWYSIDNARFLKRSPHFSSADWSALYGLASGVIALLLGVVYLGLRWDEITGAGGEDSGRNWAKFGMVNLMLALGASVIGNHLWNVASRRVPVTLVGQLILFETLFALLYGFMHQHQYPRPLEIAAMVLLTAGVIWSVRVHAVAHVPPAA